MSRTEMRDLFQAPEKYADKELCLSGWLKSNRDQKNLGFMMLSDGSFFTPLQVVYDKELPNFEEICRLGVGSAVSVRGKLVLTPEAKQAFELQALEVKTEGVAAADYPLQKKRHSFEFLRTLGHLRPRTNTFQAVFRVRSMIAFAIHRFFQEQGYVYVHTPIITSSDAEGAGEMFQVTTLDLENVPKTPEGKVDYSQDFFGRPVNLTVSGQLNVEAFCMAFGKVYTFGPTFRAENSG